MFTKRTTDYLGMKTGNFLASGGISDHVGPPRSLRICSNNFCNLVSAPPRVDPHCGLFPVPRSLFSPADARCATFAGGDQMRSSSVLFVAAPRRDGRCAQSPRLQGRRQHRRCADLALLQSVVGQGFSVLRAGHNLRSLDRLQAIGRFHFFEQSRHIVLDGTHF
jgi:hypothetical protein